MYFLFSIFTHSNNNYRPEKSDKNNQNGFDLGYVVEELIGIVIDEKKELYFIIKWENIINTEFVEATIVNEKVPQIVIAFYEKRCYWDDLTPVKYD